MDHTNENAYRNKITAIAIPVIEAMTVSKPVTRTSVSVSITVEKIIVHPDRHAKMIIP